jgi:hypothetical protein
VVFVEQFGGVVVGPEPHGDAGKRGYFGCSPLVPGSRGPWAPMRISRVPARNTNPAGSFSLTSPPTRALAIQCSSERESIRQSDERTSVAAQRTATLVRECAREPQPRSPRGSLHQRRVKTRNRAICRRLGRGELRDGVLLPCEGGPARREPHGARAGDEEATLKQCQANHARSMLLPGHAVLPSGRHGDARCAARVATATAAIDCGTVHVRRSASLSGLRRQPLDSRRRLVFLPAPQEKQKNAFCEMTVRRWECSWGCAQGPSCPW